MHGVKSCPEARLKTIGDRVFCETFKSLQLLGFTVLYYDFGMETDALTDFNNRMHEKNAELLDSADRYDAAVEKIDKRWNCTKIERRNVCGRKGSIRNLQSGR